MWRYLPGVKRPQSPSIPSKRTKSTSAPYSSDEEIDERHFVNSWKDNYPWIKYDDTNSKMYCITCKKPKKNNIFATSGSINFRRSALTDHSRSMEHVDAVRAEQESTNAAPIFTSAMEMADKAMLTLFQAAYFIAKQDIAILKFEELTNLLERCECPNLPRELYRNRDGCHELITVIGDYLDSELAKLMHNSPFLGIMIDESTDLSVRKNLVVYVNILNSDGDVGSYFAHIAEMKQCDATALTEAIIQYLEGKQIDVSKVAGLGSDGASVMVGRHNGVGAMLKKLNPFMLSMHCVAHKLALASASAASSVPYCSKHNSTLRGLYNYFHTSPNNYSVLKEMMEIFNEPEVHIQQVHTIRWLSMHRAVESVRKCLGSLLSTLSTLAAEDAVAKGLYNSLRTYKFIF